MKILSLPKRIIRRFIAEFPLNFLKKRTGQKGLIISLTSYPARLPKLHYVIRSLIRQSFQPEKIVLYLGTDTKENQIPESLKKLEKYNFEIKKNYPDIKPHKKYFFAMQEYKDSIVVTVDDDIIYHKDFLKDLYESYKKNTGCVHARRVTKLTATGNKINEYDKFEFKCTDIKEPSHSLLAIGCGGVLYPPKVFKADDFDMDAVKTHCLNTDDIWLKYMEVKNNVKVVFVPSKYEKDLSVRNTQTTGLFHTNLESGNRNDINIVEMEKYTGINLADCL